MLSHCSGVSTVGLQMEFVTYEFTGTRKCAMCISVLVDYNSHLNVVMLVLGLAFQVLGLGLDVKCLV